MKTDDVVHLLPQDAPKRISDAARTLFATHARLSGSDDVATLLRDWPAAFDVIRASATSQYTLRNHVAAARDVFRVAAVRNAFLAGGMTVQEYDAALGRVEADRAELVRAANAQQRVKRCGAQAPDAEPPTPPPSPEQALPRPTDLLSAISRLDGLDADELHRRLAWLTIENGLLYDRVAFYRSTLDAVQKLTEGVTRQAGPPGLRSGPVASPASSGAS